MYSGSVEMMCLFVRWRAKKLTPEERLKYLNKQFEKLDLNDFLRKYTDKSAMCKFSVPNSRELGNSANAEESVGISEDVQTVKDFCRKLDALVADVN